ncbi:MAG TPA: sigma-70 family RNA polymerase sigma factor [Phycisphaerales bacterium]|nr:sigma-70 family RNA polymerase sigma factor [Phycisphaerales bacterium]
MDEQSPAGAGSENPGLSVVKPPSAGAIGADEIRRIWRENRRWIAAILLAHKPREADVEDLLQVVAVAVVRKIGELRDPAALRPWLRTIAINAARASGRDVSRARRHLRLIREQTPRRPQNESCDGIAERGDEARRLMDLARTLPEGYREPLLLRCVRGMSYRQIGAVLDLPETTVETRIARGRRMLRELAAQETPARRTGTVGAV